MTAPLMHIPRADGGYELAALAVSDVVSWLVANERSVEDLLTTTRAAIKAYNTKGTGATLDLLVAAAETSADAAEVAKFGPEKP